MAAQANQLNEALSGYKREDIAMIIDRLAGDKDNLRVELKNVKLKARNQKIVLNGVINFKIYHETPTAHIVLKEAAKNG
jgi:hypothetical protein